ncbi:drug/metabolite transporter (DMT)-like permease [Desulfomicrobium macestii]|uniref:EamA-like transporter family protein n=2 Tax=Desulfomicrobium TaxID=898 RepID=A0A8G2F6K9_DESNO|nr:MULTISPECIES: DMT family transporter [Desulfomicrobium]MBE1423893.1 drug/metabolite transporter (DMT)-like permease [Desulfomicrobium macestii]SFL44381.1 EamA-like transporter family protein [Desulfomicrobium norvegicum]
MKPYLYAFGAVLCWASLPAATGSGLDGLDVTELLFFSFVPAALYLVAQEMIISRRRAIPWPDLKLTALGVAGIFGYHALYYLALDHAPLVEGAILTTTWSFWIVVMSSILANKRLSLPVLGVALVGLVGAGLVVSGGKGLHFETRYLPGYLMALGCGLVWSSFSVALSRLRLTRDYMPAFTVLAALFSTLVYAASAPQALPPAGALFSALYLGLVPLGLSFTLWNRAVTTGNMTLIGYLSYLTPPLAVLLAALIRGATVTPHAVIGMAVILAAAFAGRRLS